ncbi:hypothetical protein IWX90DRAFT_411520 [Phyllosticta citrichinensis]|uniref:Uncharacterized protein n=1 Tax=Phyllosticta citrichinensis TaxID=1130410 RepID=A0ABR1Y8K9_9PEZI
MSALQCLAGDKGLLIALKAACVAADEVDLGLATIDRIKTYCLLFKTQATGDYETTRAVLDMRTDVDGRVLCQVCATKVNLMDEWMRTVDMFAKRRVPICIKEDEKRGVDHVSPDRLFSSLTDSFVDSDTWIVCTDVILRTSSLGH